jgi:hypothetical protein
MFDVPIDAWYLWLGLAAASVAVFGVAAQLPTEPPPDATAAANAVDVVASSPHPASLTYPLTADESRLGPERIALRTEDGTARASFAYGPVTSVQDGTLLWEVLRGARPSHVFESPAALERAATAARESPAKWRPADDHLRVRRISWEGVDVTLVEA